MLDYFDKDCIEEKTATDIAKFMLMELLTKWSTDGQSRIELLSKSWVHAVASVSKILQNK